jgi:hypothetical protein
MIELLQTYVSREDPEVLAVPLEIRDQTVVISAMSDHRVLQTVEIPIPQFLNDFVLLETSVH